MTFVSTMAQTKDDRIYIRVSEQNRIDFDLVAEHKGLTRSGFLHSLVVKAIYEARKETPEIFEHKEINKMPTISIEEAKADDERKRKGKGKK